MGVEVFRKGVKRADILWKKHSLRTVHGSPDIPFKLVAILERSKDSSCWNKQSGSTRQLIFTYGKFSSLVSATVLQPWKAEGSPASWGQSPSQASLKSLLPSPSKIMVILFYCSQYCFGYNVKYMLMKLSIMKQQKNLKVLIIKILQNLQNTFSLNCSIENSEKWWVLQWVVFWGESVS